MKKKSAPRVNSHMFEKLIKIAGSVVFLLIFTLPLLFYVFMGFTYLPSWQYILIALVSTAIFIYCYILTLSIKSPGKIVLILVLLTASITTSAILLAIFTPLLDFILAKLANQLFCARIPMWAKDSPPTYLLKLQVICRDLSFKFLFGY